MRRNITFALAILGLVAGLVAAWIFGIQRQAQPPAFPPTSNPYATAIYADGIVESDQDSGSNINIYPDVSGRVTRVLAREGQAVAAGAVLMNIDDSVQRATTEQLHLQAQAGQALLDELLAQPRRETLAIAISQVELADANVTVARDQDVKRRASFAIDPRSISRDVVDTADDTLRQAVSALEVARKQLALTRAGAWSFEVLNQRRQVQALQQAWQAAQALLDKYVVRAQADGVVLSVNTTAGGYVSSLGAYDTYTQGQDPLVVMSAPQKTLAVRCYVDEILIARLPAGGHLQAQMSIRGNNVKVPLEFVRVQPYVSPKIELSDQRQEQVDLRVLPVLFRFKMTSPTMAYPGQLVDVFIGPT